MLEFPKTCAVSVLIRGSTGRGLQSLSKLSFLPWYRWCMDTAGQLFHAGARIGNTHRPTCLTKNPWHNAPLQTGATDGAYKNLTSLQIVSNGSSTCMAQKQATEYTQQHRAAELHGRNAVTSGACPTKQLTIKWHSPPPMQKNVYNPSLLFPPDESMVGRPRPWTHLAFLPEEMLCRPQSQEQHLPGHGPRVIRDAQLNLNQGEGILSPLLWWTKIYPHTYARTRACSHACMRARARTHACMHACRPPLPPTDANTRKQTHAHTTHMQSYTHTHTHTHSHLTPQISDLMPQTSDLTPLTRTSCTHTRMHPHLMQVDVL